MKRVAEAFYGRAGVYEAALAADDRRRLRAAVARNVFAARSGAAGAPASCRLYDEAARTTGRATSGRQIDFPDPAGVPRNTGQRS